MRAFLVLVAVVLVLTLVGWIKFSNTPQQSTITVDKEAIKQDTSRMVEHGNEFLDSTRQAIGTDMPTGAAPQAAPSSEPASAPTTVEPAPEPTAPVQQPDRPGAAPPTTTIR